MKLSLQNLERRTKAERTKSLRLSPALVTNCLLLTHNQYDTVKGPKSGMAH